MMVKRYYAVCFPMGVPMWVVLDRNSRRPADDGDGYQEDIVKRDGQYQFFNTRTEARDYARRINGE